MDRIVGWALIVAIVGGFVALAIIASRIGPEVTCGDPKLAATLSSSEVAWDEFGWSSEEVELRPVRSASYRFIPEGACELGFVSRPGGLAEGCSSCIVVLMQVATTPSEALTDAVVLADSSHENYNPVSLIAERHWEEAIPLRFRDTSGSIFSWTASGCRFVSVRWDLSNVDYDDSDGRRMRAAAFLESLDGDGCTSQPLGLDVDP